MTRTKHKPRIAVAQAASLMQDGNEAVACTIIDVSVEGFRLAVPRGIPCGEGYTLSFSGEAHRVAIRWAALGEVGGEFLD